MFERAKGQQVRTCDHLIAEASGSNGRDHLHVGAEASSAHSSTFCQGIWVLVICTMPAWVQLRSDKFLASCQAYMNSHQRLQY